MFWALFLLPAIGVLSPKSAAPSTRKIFWWACWALFVLLVGFRHEVGGDWGAYLRHFDRVKYLPFGEALEFGDPAYYGVMWLVSRLDLSVHWSNLVMAIIVLTGVFRFARAQPMPWVALLVAVPYLIIVVAMGYTRQSAALGLAMLGLVALGDGKTRLFVFWVIVAAAFHKSAVLLLPFGALAAVQNRTMKFTLVGITSLAAAYFFLADDSDALIRNYVETDYQSSGGAVRVLMNCVPAAIFMLWGKRLTHGLQSYRLWWWLSVFALTCLPLLAVLPSTAVDRVALYFIPIQMYVFSRVYLLALTPSGRRQVVLGVVTYYAAVQFVWLNYATHAKYWLPYKFIPL